MGLPIVTRDITKIIEYLIGDWFYEKNNKNTIHNYICNNLNLCN